MEEGEQRRGEEMGLTVKQRQAVMNELRGQYLHTPPNEKSRILDGFVDQGASQSFLLRQVPVQTAAEWDPPRPGFVAVDLVTHEGSVAGGEDACTLDVTDARAGWTETRAVRNKNQEHVFAALRGIRSDLAFPLLGIHSEYGSEFMNNHQGPLPSARAHHQGTVTSVQEE